MNAAYTYWSKQVALPICKVAALLAEYKVAMEDVRLENYDDQYKIFYDGYLGLCLRNRDVFLTKESEQEDDPTRIMVNVEAFVAWAYDKQIPMPNEFLEVIDKADTTIYMRPSAIDKLIFQGVARAIWYFEPGLTQNELVQHEVVKRLFRKSYKYKTLINWVSGIGKKARLPQPSPGEF